MELNDLPGIMKDCQEKLCEFAQPFPDSCCLLLLFLSFFLVNSGKALEKTVWDLRDLLIAGARWSSPKFYFYFYFHGFDFDFVHVLRTPS